MWALQLVAKSVSVDKIQLRNPLRFIPPTVRGKYKKQKNKKVKRIKVDFTKI
jgi:hypothetical protein